MIVIFMSCWKSCHCKTVGTGGQGERSLPPDFGRSVNSILTEGPDCTHHSTTRPGFLDPPTALPLLLDIQSIHHFVSFMTRLLITVTQIFGLASKLEHFLKVPSLLNDLNAIWAIHIWRHQFFPTFLHLSPPSFPWGPVATFLIPCLIQFSSVFDFSPLKDGDVIYGWPLGPMANLLLVMLTQGTWLNLL